MQQHSGYKTALIILIVIVALQALVLLTRQPAPTRRTAPEPAAPVRTEPARPAGKIAVVLDDWGYTLANIPALVSLKVPITVSVLPRLVFSNKVAMVASQAGCEVILHLPSEPHERRNLEKDTILVSMDARTITRIVSNDLDSLRFAKGISNHMGSKVTEDRRVMAILLKVIKQRGLYFLDSVVTSKTVAGSVAHELKVPHAKRDVFLDNSDDPAYIRQQVEKLKKKARMSGYAIGIGHDRPATLQVLKEMVPELAREGFEVVPVSTLTRS